MHTEQKVWSNWSLRQQNYLNYPTFTEYFVITWLLSVHVLLWGPLFVEAPVRPNMLNMPKSVSECQLLQPLRYDTTEMFVETLLQFLQLTMCRCVG